MLKSLRTRRNGVSVGETFTADPQSAAVAGASELNLPHLDGSKDESSPERLAEDVQSPSGLTSQSWPPAAARPLPSALTATGSHAHPQLRKAQTCGLEPEHMPTTVSSASQKRPPLAKAQTCCLEALEAAASASSTVTQREGQALDPAHELPALLTSAARTNTCQHGVPPKARAAEDDQSNSDRQATDLPQRRGGNGRRVSVALHDEVMGAPLRAHGGRRVTLSLRDETMEDIRSALRIDGGLPEGQEVTADAAGSISPPGSPAGRGCKNSRPLRNGPGIYKIPQASKVSCAADGKDAVEKAVEKGIYGNDPCTSQAGARDLDENLEQLQRALRDLVPAKPQAGSASSSRSHGARRNAASSDSGAIASGVTSSTAAGRSACDQTSMAPALSNQPSSGHHGARAPQSLDTLMPVTPASSVMPSPRNDGEHHVDGGQACSPTGSHALRVPRAVRNYMVQLGGIRRGGEGTQPSEEPKLEQRNNKRHGTENGSSRPRPSPRGLCEELARVDRATALAAESSSPAACIRRERRSSTT